MTYAAGRPRLGRRWLLGATAGSALALTGCAGETTSSGAPSGQEPGPRTSTYGPDPAQYGELYLPDATPLATVVAVHGGYWMQRYDASTTRPMCEALRRAGYVAWNLEYRRVGNGGGWPATFEDVAAGVDHLRILDVDTTDVRLVGHSAGGQLAVWAASRTDRTPGGPSLVTVTRCLSLAGVLDLTTASRLGLGGGNVDRLMGGGPHLVPDHYALGDPTRLVPATCPVACVHPTGDRVVPREQSTAYVAAAQAAGGEVTLTEVPGDHSAVIDPASPGWPTIAKLLAG